MDTNGGELMADTDERIIDVVEAFSCPHQTKEYTELYREWRRRKKNRYAFRFSRNPKETAFSENKSVIAETSAQAEKSILRRIGALIGCVLVLCLTIENILDKLLVLLLGRLGLPIGMVFLGEIKMYGEEWVVFCVAAVIHLLKFLVPAILLCCVLRMPLRVGIPLFVTDVPRMLSGILLMMFMSLVLGTLLVSRSAEMEKYRLISDAVGAEDHRLILYMLFTVLVVPLITELLLHGCLFQVLRQFGDRTAIVLTSVLAALLTHNLQDAVRIGLVTLMISCFMVTTGSFLAAALMHVTHEIYIFALFYIGAFGEEYSLEWWLLVLVPCLMGAAAVVYLVLAHKKRPERLLGSVTHLSIWDQAAAFFSAMPMLVFAVCCVLLMVTTAILE